MHALNVRNNFHLRTPCVIICTFIQVNTSVRNVINAFSAADTCENTVEVTRERNLFCVLFVAKDSLSHQLVRHSRIHSDEKPYKCFVCDKAFRQSGHLTVHVRVHTGAKSYVCSLCDKRFGISSDLRRHIRCVHGNSRPYLCPCCGKMFKTNGELKGHHVRVHTGGKPYSCGHCSDCFSSCKELKRHLLKLHSEDNGMYNPSLINDNAV